MLAKTNSSSGAVKWWRMKITVISVICDDLIYKKPIGEMHLISFCDAVAGVKQSYI